MNNTETDEPIFRANKRKRFYRRREEEAEEDRVSRGDEDASVDHEAPHATSKMPGSLDLESQIAVAEIVRRRRVALSRRGGIEFTNSQSVKRPNRAHNQSADDGVVSTITERPNILEVAAKRFAPQTGQVTESSDQHM